MAPSCNFYYLSLSFPVLSPLPVSTVKTSSQRPCQINRFICISHSRGMGMREHCLGFRLLGNKSHLFYLLCDLGQVSSPLKYIVPISQSRIQSLGSLYLYSVSSRYIQTCSLCPLKFQAVKISFSVLAKGFPHLSKTNDISKFLPPSSSHSLIFLQEDFNLSLPMILQGFSSVQLTWFLECFLETFSY